MSGRRAKFPRYVDFSATRADAQRDGGDDSGRKAIKEFWSNMVRSTNAKSALLESIDVMPADDGAVEIGRAVLVIEPGGQAASQLEVKYVVYWQQEDGRWKWHVDIWNPNS
jgi:ketosteroid isomerase-like protein